ncbi:hypothetical protein AN189_07225 [Loktanella sp. 3ANDIMAR09]|uniref:phage major tail tube protein n=1 Tax=Loktanella sp. 3ANDIMAR09 TaxID=1225657 RepID=UPI0006F9BD0E|nr:phage major tail tube protein [Loktanella sp. 3ANDIMAR09]KQI68692.1 hypothetical protein AN189_07225 [Loktanella sp. 3ANDIMAR09]
MSNIPAYIIKDCTILAAGENRIGQVMEITIPVIAKVTEEFKNAGMIKPRLVTMAYEATGCSFKETAFDPTMMKLLDVGRDEQLIALGYMQSEDGREHQARFEMRADVLKMDGGSWASGGKSETEYDCTVHSGALFIDDEEIFFFDDHTVRIGGVEQMPGRRAALAI